MIHPDVLQIEVSSDPCELPPVREAVRTWLCERGWCEHPVADVVLAIDEALTNVVRHGYCNQPGNRIVFQMRTLPTTQRGRGVEITIRDWARQVPIDSICGRNLEDLRPGGLGVHLIRKLMDEAVYEHADGGGMRLTMRRHETPQEPPG